MLIGSPRVPEFQGIRSPPGKSPRVSSLKGVSNSLTSELSDADSAVLTNPLLGIELALLRKKLAIVDSRYQCSCNKLRVSVSVLANEYSFVRPRTLEDKTRLLAR